MLIYRVYLKLNQWLKKRAKRYDLELIRKNLKDQGGEIGENFQLGNDVVISGFDRLKIGNNVSLGTGGFIRADGGLTIGNSVVISRNVVIYTTSHNYEGNKLPFDNTNIHSSVTIEDNVWIGMNVTISPGTVIREGAIIGLGTTVWGEIQKGEIVGSVKPKVIKVRNKEHYERFIE